MLDPVSSSTSVPVDPYDPVAPLTEAEQRALAQRYAPILYFHPDEQNFLQDPTKYIEQSTLRQERDFWADKELYGLGKVPPGELANIPKSNGSADSQKSLDHQNEELGDGIRTGDLNNSKNLYQYDPATNTLTYHFFYAYNNGPPGLGDAQNHEGDWEKITIQLDSNFQPTEVRYSAHSGLDISRKWSEAPSEDGRPVVYVGKGSHANFPEQGKWATESFLAKDIAERGQRFDLATRPTVDITTEPYFGTGVLWGERGTLQEFGQGFTTGPQGLGGPITKGQPREPEAVKVPLSPWPWIHIPSTTR